MRTMLKMGLGALFVVALVTGWAGAALADTSSLIVVTGRQSRVRDISLTHLLDMYKGKALALPDGSPVGLVLSGTDENRRHFLTVFMGANEKIFMRHWQNLVFKGQASRIPAIPTSPDAIRMLFASDPRTLAVIGRDELPALGNLVRPLSVDGIDPASDDYPLKKTLPAS